MWLNNRLPRWAETMTKEQIDGTLRASTKVMNDTENTLTAREAADQIKKFLDRHMTKEEMARLDPTWYTEDKSWDELIEKFKMNLANNLVVGLAGKTIEEM